MNVKGDGNDVWPWTGRNERFRFDVSKLEQWELVFSYMDRLGIMLHVVHQEQENDQLLDGGELGPERKLYYRELIARFAHHPALVWNLGEENTNTTAQLKSFARYIRNLDPYNHPIVVHTFPSKYEEVYAPLLGDPFFSGASLQVGKMERCAAVTSTWLARSAAAGRPWAAFLDEIGPAKIGVKPDSDDPDHDDVRRYALWSPMMVGGSGAGVALRRRPAAQRHELRGLPLPRPHLGPDPLGARVLPGLCPGARDRGASRPRHAARAPSAWPSPARSTRSMSPREVRARSGWRTATTRSTGTIPAPAAHCLRARSPRSTARAAGRWDRPRRTRAATG